MAVYYKIDGNNVTYTNEAKEGYTQGTTGGDSVVDGKKVSIELTDGMFIIPEDASGLFKGATNTTMPESEYFDFSVCKYAKSMFEGCTSLTSLTSYNWEFPVCITMERMFYDCIKLATLNTTNGKCTRVENLNYTFTKCQSLTRLDLSGGTLSRLSYLDYTFLQCSSLTEIKTTPGTWSQNGLSFLGETFRGCDLLESFDFSCLISVADFAYFYYPFAECYNLKSVNGGPGKNCNVYQTAGLFCNCRKLVDAGLEGTKWTANSNSYSFYGCISLEELDLTGWGPGGACERMFSGCSNLSVIKVKDGTAWGGQGNNMFSGCTKLPNWDGTTNMSKANTVRGSGYFTGVWMPERQTGAFINKNGNWLSSDVYLKTETGWKVCSVYR